MPNNLANTQDLIAIDEVKEDTVVLNGGRLVKILMVGGVNFSLKSEEEQNIIGFAYQNFLNGLDFPIQIVIHSRKINIEKYLGSLEAREAQETSGLLQSQIAEYRQFIASFVKDNPIMSKTFFVVVPFSPVNLPQKDTFTKFLPFFNKRTPAQQTAAKEQITATFRENLSQLDQRVSRVTDGLRAIGLEVATLANDALIELFYNFYNPETTERENINLPKEHPKKEE